MPLNVALKAPGGRHCIYRSAGNNWASSPNVNIDNWVATNLLHRNLDGFLAYNDELPQGTSKDNVLSGGHCKGVLCWGGNSLYWLIHSVPQVATIVLPELHLETARRGMRIRPIIRFPAAGGRAACRYPETDTPYAGERLLGTRLAPTHVRNFCKACSRTPSFGVVPRTCTRTKLDARGQTP